MMEIEKNALKAELGSRKIVSASKEQDVSNEWKTLSILISNIGSSSHDKDEVSIGEEG